MVTIIDVANRAGVSRSTVSLVINDSPLVKAETRILVKKIIEEMGYVPNNNARSLSSSTTNNLGIIYMQDNQSFPATSYDYDQSTGLYSMNIVNGIMLGLSDTNYGIVTERFCSLDSGQDLPLSVKSCRVDGVIIVGSPCSSRLIRNLQRRKIPFVLAGADYMDDSVDSVYAVPDEGVRLSFEYLVKTGHHRICLLNCPETFGSFQKRHDGFLKSARDAGTALMDPWEIISRTNRGEGGYLAFKAYWEAGNRPDGVIAANDKLALGTMRYFHEAGIRVPRDISIIAYEDSSLCGYTIPSLTSINIQKEQIGEQAARCLVERISNPHKPPMQIPVTPYLVCRESVLSRQ